MLYGNYPSTKTKYFLGRSTVSQILTLRIIVEEIKTKNLSVALIFIDFRKAFDSINRVKMFEILHVEYMKQ